MFLFLLFFLSGFTVSSQELNANNLYKQAVSIDAGSLPNKTKLTYLYQLKADAESNNLVHDSGYIITLIKIAKYEYWQNENYQTAIQYNVQALHLINEAAGAVSDGIIINAYYNLAFCYYKVLYYSKALNYFDSVLLRCKPPDPNGYIISSRYYKTVIYSYIGDYEKTTDESTLGLAEASQQHDTAAYLSLLNLRAYSLLYEGKLQQATADVEIAVMLGQQRKDSFELANAFNIKAIICDKENNFKEAEFFFKKNIAIRPHNSTTDYQTIANDYNDLANFYLNSLHDYKKAKSNYEIAIRYGRQCDTLIRNMVLFMAQSNLASVAIGQHLYDNAIQCYNQALSCINIKTTNSLLSDVSSKQLAIISNKNVLFPFLFGKTELLLQLYKATHGSAYLNACLQAAMLTDTLLTQTRHENIGEKSKLYWRIITRDFFSDAIEACYYAQDVDKAFYFMEKSSAVLLNDRWNELNAGSQLWPAEKARLSGLQIAILEAQQLLSTLHFNSKQYLQTQDSLLQTRSELEHFIKLLEKDHPAYYQYKYADEVPALPYLQEYLSKNQQSFVHYFTNDTVMYALAITPRKTTFIRLSQKDFDNRQLTTFLSLCSDKERLNESYASFAVLAQNIYRQLLRPLQLPAGNVAICTDNFLIPFEALCTDAGGKDFLLYHYNFSYVYSARSLIRPVVNDKVTGNFIGFAPVDFAQNMQLVPLRQSADALSQSASFYSNHTLFTKTQATRNNFFHNASNYAVITVFSHAKADTSGREPVLYMQDSAINLSELQLLQKASAQFALLSACQTNIGKNATGEGIYSLARGFAAAGIPSIAATLWKADDQTIYRISAKLNEYLAAGMNKNEALQKAKLWFLQNGGDGEHRLPYYWANMVLIGNTQPVILTKAANGWWWIAAIVLSVAALTMIALVLKRNRTGHFNATNYTISQQEQLIHH